MIDGRVRVYVYPRAIPYHNRLIYRAMTIRGQNGDNNESKTATLCPAVVKLLVTINHWSLL